MEFRYHCGTFSQSFLSAYPCEKYNTTLQIGTTYLENILLNTIKEITNKQGCQYWYYKKNTLKITNFNQYTSQ